MNISDCVCSIPGPSGCRGVREEEGVATPFSFSNPWEPIDADEDEPGDPCTFGGCPGDSSGGTTINEENEASYI